MLDQPARTRAWLADLAAIVAELDSPGRPAMEPAAPKRRRKPKPFWEE